MSLIFYFTLFSSFSTPLIRIDSVNVNTNLLTITQTLISLSSAISCQITSSSAHDGNKRPSANIEMTFSTKCTRTPVQVWSCTTACTC